MCLCRLESQQVELIGGTRSRRLKTRSRHMRGVKELVSLAHEADLTFDRDLQDVRSASSVGSNLGVWYPRHSFEPRLNAFCFCAEEKWELQGVVEGSGVSGLGLRLLLAGETEDSMRLCGMSQIVGDFCGMMDRDSHIMCYTMRLADYILTNPLHLTMHYVSRD